MYSNDSLLVPHRLIRVSTPSSLVPTGVAQPKYHPPLTCRFGSLGTLALLPELLEVLFNADQLLFQMPVQKVGPLHRET